MKSLYLPRNRTAIAEAATVSAALIIGKRGVNPILSVAYNNSGTVGINDLIGSGYVSVGISNSKLTITTDAYADVRIISAHNAYGFTLTT